jgi:hypothetical protein
MTWGKADIWSFQTRYYMDTDFSTDAGQTSDAEKLEQVDFLMELSTQLYLEDTDLPEGAVPIAYWEDNPPCVILFISNIASLFCDTEDQITAFITLYTLSEIICMVKCADVPHSPRHCDMHPCPPVRIAYHMLYHAQDENPLE